MGKRGEGDREMKREGKSEREIADNVQCGIGINRCLVMCWLERTKDGRWT